MREGATWKVLRVVAGLALLGLAAAAWNGNFVKADFVSVLIGLASVGSVLLTTGVLGLVRRSRDGRPGGVPASKVAWVLAALVLAIPLTAVVSFAGRAINFRHSEAIFWPPEGATAEAWHQYLYSLGERHAALAATQARPETLAQVTKVLALVPATAEAHLPLYGLQVRLEQATRGGGEDDWWLDTFTPVRAHFAQAAEQYREARFREVMATRSTAELKVYRLEFPGVHEPETRAALAEKYRAATVRYEQLINGKRTNPESVAGIRALLSQDVDAFVVPVVFLPVKGLDAAELEDVVKQKTGAKEVVPVSPSFTPELNAARRYSVTFSMNEALAPVVGDLFQLREGSPEETRTGPRFLVGQTVFPSGSVYASLAEKERPLAEQTLFMGVAMRFECTVQVPKEGAPLEDELARGHRFTLLAKPAPDISAATREGKFSGEVVYNAMANSAFDSFRDGLLEAWGLGGPGR
jgi:hypothetical protein